MKRCPQCGREYDNTMMFCLDDGAELLYGPAKSVIPAVTGGTVGDEPATAILSGLEVPPTGGSGSEPGARATGFRGDEGQTAAFINTTNQTAILPRGAEAEPQKSLGEATEKRSFSANRAAKPLVASVVAVAVLLGSFFGYRYINPAASAQINSIAVLPFENKSSDVDSDYLSDGLAESLIYRLSQLPNLKVSPTSSVFHYKGKEIDPNIVARELGVDSVLTGRITQRGDNLNISVNLVDTLNGKSLWGEHYERKTSELLATQREIAGEITNKLQLKLSGAGEQKLDKQYTQNNEAYHLYLKGNFYTSQYTKESLAKGAEYYNKAIAIDPNYALAYNGLAYYYIVTNDWYLSPKDAMPKAKDAAQHALAIDETLADAHTLLGVVLYQYEWDWPAAEKELRRAVELSPNDPVTRKYYSWCLGSAGRSDQAVAEGIKAQELDPLSPEVAAFQAQVFIFSRRTNEAISQSQKAVELDSNFWLSHDGLGRAYEQKGDLNQALAEYQRARQVEQNVPEVLALVGRAYALMDKKAEAQKVIDELQELSKRSYIPPYNFAVVYEALGDKDNAFAYLNRACDDRSYYMTWLRVDSQLDNLRADPRFKNLLKRVNLPE